MSSKQQGPENNKIDQERVGQYRQFLQTEQPKIDAALKSFASWIVTVGGGKNASASAASGRSSSSNHNLTWTMPQVLQMTRIVSQSINQYIFAVQPTASSSEDIWKMETTAQVWNQLVSIKAKPTKQLGRTALQCAWKSDKDLFNDIVERSTSLRQDDEGGDEGDDWNEKVQTYLTYFERLLFDDNDPDSKLVWEDTGTELARRATERIDRAAQWRQEQEAKETTPSVEEITEEQES